MPEVVIIDGNNLLHALRELGPARPPGRERLVRLVEHWARQHYRKVTLVFDGPPLQGPFADQMQSGHVEVIFSGKKTADDCIVERLAKMRAGGAEVVTDDKAIQHEARSRKCGVIGATLFVAALFPGEPASPDKQKEGPAADKSGPMSPAEREQWMKAFGDAPDEPFDGFEAMQY